MKHLFAAREVAFAFAVLTFLDFARAGAVDVTTLGAKNDGSADVSDIVNEATNLDALFFPAGVYKVAKPLKLRNSIFGAGYSRLPRVDATRTWLVSDIAAENDMCGVIEFGGDVQVTIENLNIRCRGVECGVLVSGCRQATSAYLDRVGIFDVDSYGVCVRGGGSRPVFASDMTIFGRHGESTARSVAISIWGAVDCRLSDIEMMGTCVGLELYNSHTYGSNLHIWTGCLGRRSAAWWKRSRGIVLGPNGRFSGSQIYPDTCYYAIEEAGLGTSCEIANLMYWEDDSVPKDSDREGAFLKRHADGSGRLVVNGGMVGVTGTDEKPGAMRFVYSPGETFRGVLMKNNYSISPANLDRLCLGGDLPDYMVRYSTNGFCKVADILTPVPAGSCEVKLVRDDGAAWRVGVVKSSSGVDIRTRAVNALATVADVRAVVVGDHVKVFLRAPSAAPMAWTARLTTLHMGERCRPLDYGSLRDMDGHVRYREHIPDDAPLAESVGSGGA